MISSNSPVSPNRIAPVTRPVEKPAESEPASNVQRTVQALIPTELTHVESPPPVDKASITESVERLTAQLRETAKRVNAYLKETDTHLEFEVGDLTGRTIVRVINTDTGEVIRQIPAEGLVQFAERATHLRGLLFEAQG